MLSLLNSGKRIINVDETWLNETNFTRKVWCRPDSTCSETIKAISPSLSMIAALDTDGRVFFSLGHAATDHDTLMLFLRHLAAELDKDSPGWQEDATILLDNAPYHTGEEIKSYMLKMQLPVMYTAPYSYSSSPIETLFAHLKLGELNVAHEPTGKK